MPHVPWRDELAFLDIDSTLAQCGRSDEIGLTAEECRNLEHVSDLGDFGDIHSLVHIGEHGHMHLITHLPQYTQTFSQTRAPETPDRSPVRLVVGSLEDEREVERPGHAFDYFRHADCVVFALNDARPGDEEEIARADGDIADFECGGQWSVSSDCKKHLIAECAETPSLKAQRKRFSPAFSQRAPRSRRWNLSVLNPTAVPLSLADGTFPLRRLPGGHGARVHARTKLPQKF